MTRAKVAFDTLAPGLKQRDTADCDTPARLATSYEVTRRASRWIRALMSAMVQLSGGVELVMVINLLSCSVAPLISIGQYKYGAVLRNGRQRHRLPGRARFW